MGILKNNDSLENKNNTNQEPLTDKMKELVKKLKEGKVNI